MARASLPFVIQESLKRFDSYLSSVSVVFGRSGDHFKAMRSDRRENISRLVGAMLLGCCLQHGGVICHLSRFWARPMSLPELARLAGLTGITAARCMADLVNLELVASTQIKRKSLKTGRLEVSIGLRCFTDKFWEALGLLEKFKEAMDWAKKNARRQFLLPFKSIKQKAKSTLEQIGNLTKSVLRDLDVGALKVKANCAEIQKLCRQRK